MSQIWQVIAPGRKETTGCLGQLVDALRCHSAADIVPLLTVQWEIRRCVILPARMSNSETDKSIAKN